MSPGQNPQREFAVDVVERLRAAGFQALWAGGCVRDLLLGREPHDYDVATDARPEQVRQVFGRRQTVAVGASFGVILVLSEQSEAGSIEVATFRSEGPYQDGRRPSRVTFCSAEEDANRRDFTINGMFYDPLAHHVLDYVEGEHDLGQRIIRAIGHAEDRMTEDKLRLLRAVRFAATLEFQLELQTANAVRKMACEISVVSTERITQELRKMLLDPHRRRALELCVDLGLFPVIFPEASRWFSQSELLQSAEVDSAWGQTLTALSHLAAPTFPLAFATLVAELVAANAPTIRGLCRRFRLSNAETEEVVWLLEHRDGLQGIADWPLHRQKRFLVHPQIRELLEFQRARALSADLPVDDILFCEDFLARVPAEDLDPQPLLTGKDLVAAGWKPGPRFREVLEAVRDAQLAGTVTTPAAAHELASRLQADAARDKTSDRNDTTRRDSRDTLQE